MPRSDRGTTRSSLAVAVTAAAVAVILPACGGGGASDDWIPATLASNDGTCREQRAMVPASGVVTRTFTPATSQVTRTATDEYVSFAVRNPELLAYFSFAPDLPAQPSTDTARAMLKYAYVDFKLTQPRDVGGSLELLNSADQLAVADFERFEVVGGKLSWRLERRSSTGYSKALTIYDDDPSNDPPPGTTCMSGDILGQCVCSFSGPEIAVSLDGVTAL